nr:hypothetical protein Iba_chr02aCG20940 [Ipomoea batatas]
MYSDLTMPITQDCFSISYVPYRTMANSMANVAHKPEIKKKVTLPVQRSRDSRSMALCNAKSLSKATNMLACFDSKASCFQKIAIVRTKKQSCKAKQLFLPSKKLVLLLMPDFSQFLQSSPMDFET